MPQPGQIIPEYLHPHVMTVINDNTEFTETVASAEEGLRSIFVFASSKGRDGVVIPFDNPQKFIEEYGRPNFRLYGQPAYNAHAFLSTGIARGFCMRVMPEDATYANLVVVAKVKVDTTVPAEPKMIVRFEALHHTGVTSTDEVEALTDLLTDIDPDVDGFQTYPLAAFYSQGRGVYGDGFRIRLTSSPQADKENDYKNYRVEVLELENTITRKEVFTGSVFPEAITGITSLFLEDIVNDSDTGSNKLNVYVPADSYQAIFDLYKTQVAPTTALTVETFDVLTGSLKEGGSIPGFEIDRVASTAVALDMPEGITLSGGDDGSFKLNPASPEARETAMNTAYAKAFAGDYDAAILSKRRTPADVIFDAGYADEVKRALITLINKRYDAYGFIDGGILNTLTDAFAWGESMVSLGDRIFSKEFQHYKIRDPFSGKNIPVTMTYLYARLLPNHFRTFGNQTPFVGEQMAALSGAIKNTLRPVVDADDSDVKEKLYNLRLNYFQALAENVYVRGTQGTSQNKWSDLSEENNMHVLLEMKRELETMVGSLTYNFAEAADRQRFTEAANRLFSGYAGTKVRSATVEFQMNAFEEERSILHCYLAVTFRTMAKRSIVEIDINKRV